MKAIREPWRDTPVVVETDVAVCGGGPAGVAAALASARAGARTVLVEQHACLGGIWTAGALSWILDHENKAGIMQEILGALTARGARAMRQGNPTNGCDVEKMKLLLDELCVGAEVDVRLYTRVVDALVGTDRRLTHAPPQARYFAIPSAPNARVCGRSPPFLRIPAAFARLLACTAGSGTR